MQNCTQFFITLFWLLCSNLSFGQYCSPASQVGTGLGSYIDSVGILDLSSLTGPSVAPYYQLFSDVPVLNLEAGGNYNLTVVSGSMVNDFFTIWVDWNNDLDFDDEGENMGEQNNALPAQVLVFPFNVPANTSTSFKRLRIRCGPNVNLEPCTEYTYGETEDYRLLILPAPSSYCAPSSFGGSANGMFIEAVRLNEFVQSTGASSAPFYAFADTLMVPKLTKGSTQKVMVKGGTNTFMKVGAWIDWNRDGDYYDTGEDIGQEIHNQSLQAHEFYFDVPDTIISGMYRMRVRCAGTSNTMNPCANYVDGETEDYRVEVIDSVAGYCIPSFSLGTSNSTFLNRITLNEMLIDLFASSAPSYYLDFSGSYNKASLKANKSYVVTLGAEGLSYASTRYGVWIDYNRDGDFNDDSEYLGERQVNSQYGQTFLLFTTPTLFEPGLTRMRVIAASSGGQSLNPCGNYTYGECKDFGIELLQFSAGLCVPELGNTDQGDFIDAFSLGDIQVEEGAYGAGAYQYYGDRVYRTTPGSNLMMNIRAGGEGLNTQYVAAWIDWNNNLTFEESERVGVDTLQGVAFPNLTFNTVVPSNQATGFLHVRVRIVRNALNNPPVLSACSQHSYGETEDYRLYVQPNLPTYCSSLHSNAGLSGVSINKVSLSYTELNKNQTGCESLSGNAYTQWPITTTTAAVLLQLQSYYLSVDADANARVGVWFDTNQNGQFETTEYYSVFSTVGNTRYYLITTSPGMPLGYARLRVRVRNGGAAMTASEACVQFTDGETEDFMVFIDKARGAAPIANFDVIQNGEEANYSSDASNFSDFFNWSFLGSVSESSPGTNPTVYYSNASPGCYATALSVSNDYGADVLVNPCAVYIPETQQCSKLFISEYLCSPFQDKAIELVNASNATLNLSGYSLALYANGSLQPIQVQPLSGELQPFQSYLVVHPGAQNAIQAQANLLSGICSFTGNDVIALLFNGTIIDMVGMLGQNPPSGWLIGSSSTSNVDLRRSNAIGAPNADWMNGLLGWLIYPASNVEDLGSHTFACGTFQVQLPNAQFSVSQTEICVGDCIGLIDESTGTPSTWSWLLPGAVTTQANGANPGNICYLNAGNYSITLNVSNGLGSDEVTVQQAISVMPYLEPVLSLSGDVLECSGCGASTTWYLDGEVLSEASGTTYQPLIPGVYSVTTSSIPGCTSTSAGYTLFTVGLTTHVLDKYILYPNPASTGLNIQQLAGIHSGRYELFDLSGRFIQSRNLLGQSTLIDVSDLSTGTYLLRIVDQQHTQTIRFVKAE